MTLALLASLALVAPAASGATPPPAMVDANGNVFTGGLSFTPDHVAVQVGQAVQWMNTDPVVPHTATEDHGLWDLAGSYGEVPGSNPAGFAPGTSVSRPFEAGTQHYYCRVHTTQMKGVVAVPVSLSLAPAKGGYRATAARKRHRRHHRRRRRHRKRTGAQPTPSPPQATTPGTGAGKVVHAVWASATPLSGLAFDVQFRQNGGSWQVLRSNTTQTSANIAADAAGTVTEVRARLRQSDDADKATDWSPIASITS